MLLVHLGHKLFFFNKRFVEVNYSFNYFLFDICYENAVYCII